MNEINFETMQGGRIWRYAIKISRALTEIEQKKLDEAKSQREFLNYLDSLNILVSARCHTKKAS